MADVAVKAFSELVGDQAAAIQGSAAARGVALDFSEGSVLRALAESNASVALWLQALVLQVLALTRASTSEGADLDTWAADFGVTRLGAAYAAGDVTFSRYTPTAPAVVPVGALVRSADGAWTYAVIADTARAAWTPASNGYTIPAGTPSLALPVRATAAGVGGNAAAGTITLLASSIPGVDYVSNVSALTGGVDAESDAAMRARFVLWLGSLARATKAAIGYAISQVQAGLTYSIVESENPDGSVNLGHFYVVVDDGTGAPSGTLIANVAAAVEAYRALGISYAVIAPTLVSANVSMTVGIAAGAYAPTERAKAAAALTAYINGLALGAPLPFTRLAQVAYDASPNITSVSSVLLNGGTADITATAKQVVRAGAVTVS